MSLTIKDVLTRQVATISPDMTVDAAARLMSERRISCLVAVETERPIGIITEADLVKIVHHHIDPASAPVADFLSAPVISVHTNHTIYDAFELLLARRVRHLVVVHPDGRLEGLLTFSDILKAAEFDDFLRIKPVGNMMTVRPVTASPSLPLDDVVSQMDDLHISCMVAVEQGRVAGIFTERDTARLVAADADFGKLTLGDVMTSPMITLHRDESMLDAALLMRQHGIRRLVIVDDAEQPLGIVTQFDLVRGLEGKVIRHFRTLYEQREDQLVIEKAELERIVDVSPAVLYRCEWRGDGSAFELTYVSASVCDVLGYGRDACFEPEWWQSHIHPDDRRRVEAAIRQLNSHGEFECVYRFMDCSGNYRWLRDHAVLTPGRGDDGQADELIGSMLDVTESRQRDQQVYESEELYRSLVDQAFDGITIIGADGRVLFVNKACTAILHAAADKIVGRHYSEFIHVGDIDVMQLRFQQRMDGARLEQPGEARLLRKDGEFAWVELSGRLITWQGQPADLVILRDITERKRSELELLLHRDRSEALLKLPDLASRFSELEFIQQAQELIEDLTGSTISFVHFVRDGGEVIELTAWSRRTLDSYCKAAYDKHYPVGEAGVWADALRTKSAVVFNDYPACSHKRGLPEGHSELSRLISVPVLENGQVVMLTGVGNKANDYSDRDVESVKLLSDAIWQIVQRQREQRSLIKSEQKYRTLFEESRDMMHIVGADGRILDVNQAELSVLGYAYEELVGRHVKDIVCPKHLEDTRQHIRQLFKGQSVPLYRTALHSKSGECIPVEVAASPQFEGGEVVAGRAVIHDLRARIEHEAREVEFNRILEESLNEIYIFDATRLNFIRVNRGARLNLGYAEHELKSMTPLDIKPEFSPEQFHTLIAPLERGETESIDFETMHQRKDGSSYPVEVNLQRARFEGHPVYVAFIQDITARKMSEQKYRTLFESSSDAIMMLDADTFIDCNQATLDMFACSSRDGFLGKHPSEMSPATQPDGEDSRQLANAHIATAFREGSHRFEWVHRRLNGKDFPADILLTVVDLGDKQVLQATARDITERKRKEALLLQRDYELTEAAQQLSAAQQIAKLGHYVFDAKSGNWRNSPELDDIFGIDAHFTRDVHGWLQIVHPDFREVMAGYLQHDVLREHRPFDKEYKIINLKTGKEMWVHGLGELRFDEHNQVREMFGTIQDVTERKQSEMQMRLLENAVAAVSESIIITDAKGTIVYVNPSFSRNTGFDVDDAIGNTPAILNSKLQSEGFYQQFWDTISHGRPWGGRILDRKKDGTIFPVYLSVAPIFNEQGEISHYVAVHEDLSRAEALQKKIAHAQKMEAVGTMVGGVAHDFNNMLAGIVGNFYLIRMQHPDDEKLQQRLRTMEEATRHGAVLIQQMLTFARKDITDMHTLPLSSFIKEAYKLAAATMPENISLDLQMEGVGGVCVKADATQMQQVLLNLITNARHAVQDAVGDNGQGRVSIEVDCQPPPEHLLQENPEMISDSGWCCIRCVDNGCGIEADDLEHVFEPFFTTKEVGRGTGLGLAMVYGAVQNHRGIVDIKTAPGAGTTVLVWLPQQQTKSEVELDEDDVGVDGGGRLLLLVDDEDGLRKVLAEVLAHNGFTVLEASDGEQAVKKFSDNHEQIALVLMDVVMPNMGGVAAAQAIRALDADVPILFQTGYGEQTQLNAAGAISNSESLQKPVQIHELLSMIMAKISH